MALQTDKHRSPGFGYDGAMRNLSSEDLEVSVSEWEIRPVSLTDLDGLMQVQEACYGADYMESADIYRERLAAPGQCSLVAVQDGTVLAYLAAYRSSLGSVTPIHGDFVSATAPDTLYLHDMAVDPQQAGKGLASALFITMWRSALNWRPRYSALVSVQGSQNYWERKGYATHENLTPDNESALRSYGDEAVYMVQLYAVTP